MYRVLKPKYEKAGEVTQTPDGPLQWYRAVMVDMGVAENMADALRKFPRNFIDGYSPILEWIGKTH